MSDNDIVAELDAWLALPTFPDAPMVLCQRARDEIVALREAKGTRILEYQNIARANTLEEAALMSEHHGENLIAAAIRALKC